MSNKTLYFEGAGLFEADISKATDMKNCRVRTAFKNDDGKRIYLEIIACEVTKRSASRLRSLKYAGFVDSCFYIMGDDDENKHRIFDRNETVFEYNRANVLALVNSLGCSFDAVETLPNLAGYRVFKDEGVKESVDYYNYGDEFQYDAELTAKRENIYHHFYELEKSEGKQYPNFSLWVDKKDKNILHLLRYFNGYNGNWEIHTDTEKWEESMTETAQPLTREDIQTEAARLLRRLQSEREPNSPSGTHFMAQVSPEFLIRASTKNQSDLFKMLPFKSLTFSALKDRKGIFAFIRKDESRDQPLRLQLSERLKGAQQKSSARNQRSVSRQREIE